MTELRKPDSCPECESTAIKRIVGGRPNEEGMKMIEAGKAVPGDCFMREWKEDWYCSACEHQWCDKTDPVRIEHERLYRKLEEDLKS